MKYQLLVNAAGAKFCFRKGKVYDLTPEQAEEFVRIGWAIPAEEVQSQSTKKKGCRNCGKKGEK